MKKIMMTAVAAMTLTAPAWAQADLDTDGDGAVTFEEVQAVNPEVTMDEFAAMDINGDGVIDAEELSAAQAANQSADGEEAPTEDAPAE